MVMAEGVCHGKNAFLGLLMCVILFGTNVPNVHSDSNLPSSSATPVTFSMEFNSPDDVLKFDVKASGDGVLKVDTMDCCVEGDVWGLKAKSIKPKAKDQACGSGSVSVFSGEVSLPSFRKGSLRLYYCSGVDLFPAVMTIRFSYTGTSFTVTPKRDFKVFENKNDNH